MKNDDAVLITGRISKEDADRLDSYCSARGVSRSKAVADAVLDRINCRVCINCGAENNPEGKICSVCGTRLFSEEQIVSVLTGSVDESEWERLIKSYGEDVGCLLGRDADYIIDSIDTYTKDGFSVEIEPYLDWKCPIDERFKYCVYFKTKSGLIVRPKDEMYFTLAPSILLKELDRIYPEKGNNRENKEGK